MASLTNHTDILTKAGGASAGTAPPHDSLAAALAKATSTGDEVIYFGEASKYESLIKANGALPVQIQTDAPDLGLDMAALVRALTPRTRAVLVAREDSAAGEPLPKATMAMLTRLLTTAQNIYGGHVSLVTEEATERSSPGQSKSIASLSYAGASLSGYQPAA